MKLTLAVLMIAVAMAAAVEDSADKLIMICGDDLIAAFKQACEEKRVEYLLDHGLYDPQAKPKYQHQVQHDLDHKHGHNHGHNHGHDHGLDRNLYHSDNNNNAPKKEINESDRSIVDECCHRPCLVRDFISFCG